MRTVLAAIAFLICASLVHGFLVVDGTGYHHSTTVGISISTVNATFTADLNSTLVSWWSFDSRNSTHFYDNISGYHARNSAVTNGRYGDGVITDTGVNVNVSGFSFNRSFTISFWFKASETNYSNRSDSPILLHQSTIQGTNSTGVSIGIEKNSSKVQLAVYNGSFNVTDAAHYVLSDAALNRSWTHIVGVYNNSHMMLYIGGVLQTSIKRVVGGMATSNSTLTLGGYGGTRNANGTIDEVKAWNTSLSTYEIGQITATSTNYTLTNLTEGIHQFRVYGTHDNGSISIITENLTIDTTTPQFVNLSSAATNDTIYLNWNATEAVNGTVIYDFNNSMTLASLSMNFSRTITGLSEDSYYLINLTICDAARNCNFTSVSISTLQGTNAPNITLSPGHLYNTSRSTINFTCTVYDGNLSNVSLLISTNGTFQLNGSDTSGANGTYAFNRNISGSVEWQCKACNNNSLCTTTVARTATAGYTAMILENSTPMNGATNVSVSNIRLNFTLALAQQTFRVNLTKGESVPVSHAANGTLLTLTPYLPLKPNTTYTVTIPYTTQSVANISLNRTTSFSFRTAYADLDSDGTPDINDTDDDNDGIPDINDTLRGNVSDIYSNRNLTMEIDRETNFTNPTGNKTVDIKFQGEVVLTFPHNFSTPLDLSNISIIITDTPAAASIIIVGLRQTKTIWLEDSDGSISDVCVANKEIHDISQMSADCSGTNETKLDCSGVTQDGIRCVRADGWFKVTGLTHSAVKEVCREQWECSMWGPIICRKGQLQTRSCSEYNGCGTIQMMPETERECAFPLPLRKRGCRAEWDCGEWGACMDGNQTRSCTNIGQCADHIKTPVMTRECESNESLTESVGMDSNASEQGAEQSAGTEQSARTETSSEQVDIFADEEEPYPTETITESWFDFKLILVALIIIVLLLIAKYGNIKGMISRKDSSRGKRENKVKKEKPVPKAHEKRTEHQHHSLSDMIATIKTRKTGKSDHLDEEIRRLDKKRAALLAKKEQELLDTKKRLPTIKEEKGVTIEPLTEQTDQQPEQKTEPHVEKQPDQQPEQKTEPHVEKQPDQQPVPEDNTEQHLGIEPDQRQPEPAKEVQPEIHEKPIDLNNINDVVAMIKARKQAALENPPPQKPKPIKRKPKPDIKTLKKKVGAPSTFDTMLAKLRRFGMPARAAQQTASLKESKKKRRGRLVRSMLPKKKVKGPVALATSGMLKDFVAKYDGDWREDAYARLSKAVRKRGYDVGEKQLNRLVEMEREKYVKTKLIDK